jgi:pimeloyl-ACP methyl ester carboxylesterase
MMLTHAYADLETGVRLHYVTEGTGKLLLFLHGNPAFWYGWKRQLPAFSDRYRVVAPDLPGYNLSSKPEPVERYRMSVLADDIHAFVKQLGFETFTLIGHDMGGGIGWSYAARYPETLEKLVVISAVHPDQIRRARRKYPELRKEASYITMLKQTDYVTFFSANNYAHLVASELGEHQHLKPGTFTEEDKQAYIESWSQPGMLDCMVKYYIAFDLERDLADQQAPDEDMLLPIQVPTLFIYGEKDLFKISPDREDEIREWLRELVPGVTIEGVPDGSHVMIYDHADEVNALIQRFIES